MLQILKNNKKITFRHFILFYYWEIIWDNKIILNKFLSRINKDEMTYQQAPFYQQIFEKKKNSIVCFYEF